MGERLAALENLAVTALASDAASAHWSGRPVLVTGATGLLGGWLVRRLLAAGATVVALVRGDPHASILLSEDEWRRVRIVPGDLRDRDAVARALLADDVDTVFHVAAQAIVGEANRDPEPTLDTNIRGTWTVLEAVRHAPSVKAVVNASSDKAYGDHEVLPYDERAALRGAHPYDASKACADLLARMYAATFGMPLATTRCGNFFGGGDLNWNRIVPGTIRSAIRGERPLIRSDGSLIRDYFYIEDGAIATMELARAVRDRDDIRGEAFNFSYEMPLDVLTFSRRILARMGSALTLDVRGEAHHEIQRQWLTAAKARRLLGWSPRFTMDDGIDRSIAWYRSYLSHG